MTNPQSTEQPPENASRRRFIRTTAGGVVLAATGSGVLQSCATMASTPDTAVSAWSIKTPEAEVIRWALSHAILAPNPHNLQPWLVDLSTANEMLVAIDPERLLPETDPYGRQIMIGTGAMLGLFELAAAVQGFSTSVDWIAADVEGGMSALQVGEPVVRVRVEDAQKSTDMSKTKLLFDQIRQRHTVRAEYDPQRMPSAEFDSTLLTLKAPNQLAGVLTSVDSADDFKQISTWVKQAWEIELSTPDTVMESMRLLRVGRREIETHRDGIVIDSPFLVLLNKLGMFDRDNPPKPGSRNYDGQIERFNKSVDSTPGWFYITSNSNTRLDQLEIGKTFVKAQLHATALGMVMHPVSQGLQEYSEMADIYASMTKHMESVTGQGGSTVQMLARIGYLPTGADKPKPAPRRGIDAHIVS